MCDLSKITEKTKDLFNEMKKLQKGTKDGTRYLLGVNGLNKVVLDDIREDITIFGNREIQKFCKNKIAELDGKQK